MGHRPASNHSQCGPQSLVNRLADARDDAAARRGQSTKGQRCASQQNWPADDAVGHPRWMDTLATRAPCPVRSVCDGCVSPRGKSIFVIGITAWKHTAALGLESPEGVTNTGELQDSLLAAMGSPPKLARAPFAALNRSPNAGRCRVDVVGRVEISRSNWRNIS